MSADFDKLSEKQIGELDLSEFSAGTGQDLNEEENKKISIQLGLSEFDVSDVDVREAKYLPQPPQEYKLPSKPQPKVKQTIVPSIQTKKQQDFTTFGDVKVEKKSRLFDVIPQEKQFGEESFLGEDPLSLDFPIVEPDVIKPIEFKSLSTPVETRIFDPIYPKEETFFTSEYGEKLIEEMEITSQKLESENVYNEKNKLNAEYETKMNDFQSYVSAKEKKFNSRDAKINNELENIEKKRIKIKNNENKLKKGKDQLILNQQKIKKREEELNEQKYLLDEQQKKILSESAKKGTELENRESNIILQQNKLNQMKQELKNAQQKVEGNRKFIENERKKTLNELNNSLQNAKFDLQKKKNKELNYEKKKLADEKKKFESELKQQYTATFNKRKNDLLRQRKIEIDKLTFNFNKINNALQEKIKKREENEKKRVADIKAHNIAQEKFKNVLENKILAAKTEIKELTKELKSGKKLTDIDVENNKNLQNQIDDLTREINESKKLTYIGVVKNKKLQTQIDDLTSEINKGKKLTDIEVEKNKKLQNQIDDLTNKLAFNIVQKKILKDVDMRIKKDLDVDMDTSRKNIIRNQPTQAEFKHDFSNPPPKTWKSKLIKEYNKNNKIHNPIHWNINGYFIKKSVKLDSNFDKNLRKLIKKSVRVLIEINKDRAKDYSVNLGLKIFSYKYIRLNVDIYGNQFITSLQMLFTLGKYREVILIMAAMINSKTKENWKTILNYLYKSTASFNDTVYDIDLFRTFSFVHEHYLMDVSPKNSERMKALYNSIRSYKKTAFFSSRQSIISFCVLHSNPHAKYFEELRKFSNHVNVEFKYLNVVNGIKVYYNAQGKSNNLTQLFFIDALYFNINKPLGAFKFYINLTLTLITKFKNIQTTQNESTIYYFDKDPILFKIAIVSKPPKEISNNRPYIMLGVYQIYKKLNNKFNAMYPTFKNMLLQLSYYLITKRLRSYKAMVDRFEIPEANLKGDKAFAFAMFKTNVSLSNQQNDINVTPGWINSVVLAADIRSNRPNIYYETTPRVNVLLRLMWDLFVTVEEKLSHTGNQRIDAGADFHSDFDFDRARMVLLKHGPTLLKSLAIPEVKESQSKYLNIPEPAFDNFSKYEEYNTINPKNIFAIFIGKDAGGLSIWVYLNRSILKKQNKTKKSLWEMIKRKIVIKKEDMEQVNMIQNYDYNLKFGLNYFQLNELKTITTHRYLLFYKMVESLLRRSIGLAARGTRDEIINDIEAVKDTDGDVIMKEGTKWMKAVKNEKNIINSTIRDKLKDIKTVVIWDQKKRGDFKFRPHGKAKLYFNIKKARTSRDTGITTEVIEALINLDSEPFDIGKVKNFYDLYSLKFHLLQF